MKKDLEEKEDFAVSDDQAAVVCCRESKDAEVSSEEPGRMGVPGLRSLWIALSMHEGYRERHEFPVDSL